MSPTFETVLVEMAREQFKQGDTSNPVCRHFTHSVVLLADQAVLLRGDEPGWRNLPEHFVILANLIGSERNALKFFYSGQWLQAS